MILNLAAALFLSGCSSPNNEAVKPEKFAPPPPSDSAAEGSKGATQAEG
jgi:hypothetical protein